MQRGKILKREKEPELARMKSQWGDVDDQSTGLRPRMPKFDDMCSYLERFEQFVSLLDEALAVFQNSRYGQKRTVSRLLPC